MPFSCFIVSISDGLQPTSDGLHEHDRSVGGEDD